MQSPHPFGTEITPDALMQDFSHCPDWESRYRLIIKLAKQLPALSDEQKQTQMEISGCENRVWLGYQHGEEGRLHFYADSEGRIVKGLLAILLTFIEGRTAEEILSLDLLNGFKQLGVSQSISHSKNMGLSAMIQRVEDIAQLNQR